MEKPPEGEPQKFRIAGFDALQYFFVYLEIALEIPFEHDPPELVQIIAAQKKDISGWAVKKVLRGKFCVMGDPLPFLIHLFINGDVLGGPPFPDCVGFSFLETSAEIPFDYFKLRLIPCGWLKGKTPARPGSVFVYHASVLIYKGALPGFVRDHAEQDHGMSDFLWKQGERIGFQKFSRGQFESLPDPENIIGRQEEVDIPAAQIEA